MKQSCEKTTYLTLRNSVLDLIDLDFAETLDLEQIPTCCRMHRCNRVVAVRFELCDVYCANAVCLDCINVDDEAILLKVSQ